MHLVCRGKIAPGMNLRVSSHLPATTNRSFHGEWAMREFTDKEIKQVVGGVQPNQNAGGGPGNSGQGDKKSSVQGPRPRFPGGGQ
jgi:hypothetical protein